MNIKFKNLLFLLFVLSMALFACNNKNELYNIDENNDDYEISNQANIDKDDLYFDESKVESIKNINGYMSDESDNQEVDDSEYQINSDDVIQKEIEFGEFDNNRDKINAGIKWYIVYEDTQNKRALLASKYAIANMAYNDNDKICTWETSSIRKWLNDDFYNRAFTDEEKQKIIKTHLDNTSIRDMRIDGGYDTDDYVFLASADDVEKYYIKDLLYSSDNLSKMEIKYNYPGYSHTKWWLRNNATIKENKMFYDSKLSYYYEESDSKEQNLIKGVNYDGADSCDNENLVRPFIWIEYDGADELKIDDIEPNEKLKIGKNMNRIHFGIYQNEEIEWEIIDRVDNKALLLSRYVLDTMPYSDSGNWSVWEKSSIRNWLNNDFYNSSFNEKEKLYISKTLLKNKDNENTAINGGKDTIDNIFLLSYDDLNKYMIRNDAYFYESKKYCRTYPTLYVREKNGWDRLKDDIKWWIRTPGFDYSHAQYANFVENDITYLECNEDGTNIENGNIGVRPAMWVYFDENIENDIVNENAIVISNNIKNINVGKYYNDNANSKFGITWEILEKDEINKKALLLSDVVIDAGSFSDDNNINWDESRVRQWLNNDFYNENFSDEEKNAIVTSKITTTNLNEQNKNKYIEDKIFLLSREDILYYFTYPGERASKATEYAKKVKSAKTKHEKNEETKLESANYSPYWLRSSKNHSAGVDLVNTNGKLSNTYSYGGIDMTTEEIGIRPAMWVNYKDGVVKFESSGSVKIRDIVDDLFNKDIDINSVAITENFKKQINSDPFMTFGLYNDNLHKYKATSYNKKNNTLVLKEFKNNMLGTYHHPYYKDMGVELRDLHFAYTIDNNGYIDGLTPIYTDRFYTEDFEIAKNGILFNENNFDDIISDLCFGQYLSDKRKENAEEEKFKYFYRDYNQYALSDKYREEHDLQESIIDKNRFMEIANYEGTNKVYAGEEYFVSAMEIDPEKNKKDYFEDCMLPIAFNFDKERIYYNIYFTYTDDYMLDTINVEEVKRIKINKGNYEPENSEDW